MDESRLNCVRTLKTDDEKDETAYLSESESEDCVKHNALQQMDDPKLQNIISALGEDSNEETDAKVFFSESGLNLSDISVEVESIGSIKLPLTKNCIEKLIGISSKAKCGLHEHSILDENVRDTQEIVAEKLRVNIKPSSMTQLLNTIHEDLGLDKLSYLTPHLHKMLIYSPGNFFLKHQDIEKVDNMIATLVIVLPSAHIGGDLIIYHEEEKHVFSTENLDQPDVKCVAFYADCLHEMEKVKHGYRIALTFYLVLNAAQSPSNEVNQRLNDAIQNYFCDENSKEPQKLVYFLNHQYSEQGLQWRFLKGKDRVHVSALLNAAKCLRLVPHLALAEIKQCFSRMDFSDEDEESEDEDEESEDDDRGDIGGSQIILQYWVDVSNRKVDRSYLLKVADNEICWTKGIRSFKPFKTEHGGHMDDGSGCKDFSYQRAAVVLWAESRQIAMNFLLNRKNATDELSQLIREPGNESTVIDILRGAGQYLYSKWNNTVEEFINLSEIVLYVHDKSIAMQVLSPFFISIVQVSTAETLAKLQNEYGVEWFIDMLNKWGKDKKFACQINQVDDFLYVFLKNKGDLEIAELLLEQQSVAENDAPSYLNSMGSKIKLEKLTRIFKACEIISNVSMLHKIIQRVIANYEKYPVLELVDLFLNLKNEISQDFYPHFGVLKIYLVSAINAELVVRKDFADDWSLKVRINCNRHNCDTCSEVIRFLTSKTEVRSYPFQAKFRRHVCSKLRNLYLPIEIMNHKRDSPYQSFFCIEKKPSMHAKAREIYEKLLYCKEAFSVHQF